MPQPAAPRMVVPSSAAPRLRRLTGEAAAMRKVLFEWDAMSCPVAEEKAGRIAVELVEDLRHLVEGVARLEDQRGQIRQRGVRKPIYRLARVAHQPVGLIEQPAGCRDIGAQAADKLGKGWPVVGDDAVHVGRDIGEAAQQSVRLIDGDRQSLRVLVQTRHQRVRIVEDLGDCLLVAV